jgi:hypothetical protein
MSTKKSILVIVALFISMTCPSEILPLSGQSCSKGAAQRVLHRDEPAHILVALEGLRSEEDKAIAGVWRRILLRIPDVRLVGAPVNADLAILLSIREVHNQDHSIEIYVWHAKVVQPWTVACGTTRETYYLEQPTREFMNYASTLETASEMIQKSVNAIEDMEFQTIREEKRK